MTTWQLVIWIVVGVNTCGTLWLVASWIAVWHDRRQVRRARRRKRREDRARSWRVRKLQRELEAHRKLETND